MAEELNIDDLDTTDELIAERRAEEPGQTPEDMTPWQLRAAKAGHWLLYLLIGFLLISGIVTAINATNPIMLFGSLDITIGQTGTETFVFLRQFHEFAKNAVIVLIVIHILAALYHHFVAKHDLTVNMLKFWRRPDS